MLAAALVLFLPAAAHAAGPGEVFPIAGLDLPAGAIAGGAGGYAEGESTSLGMSADGRYVAFAADADALSADAHPDVTNVFRKDRVTGAVVLVSRASGANGAPAGRFGAAVTISDDGNRVAWLTSAALDPGDGDGASDVYVRDIATGTTLLATPGTIADVSGYDLSGNGAFVAFATTAPLAGASDANGVDDVYRRRLSDGFTVLVSLTAGAVAGNAASGDPSISDDGGWVAFSSAATDLVAAFTNANGPSRDVFARDIAVGATYLVSKVGAANTGGNGHSVGPDIAGAPAAMALSGVHIAYQSSASDLAAADTSPDASVFRRELSVAGSVLVSRADGPGGASADSRAHDGSISDSGALVAFASDADNLSTGPEYYGVYVRDVGAGTTKLGSVDTRYAVEPALSDDGALVAWVNGFGGITPDSDPDLTGVFARAYPDGATDYVSRPPGTAPFLAPVAYTEPAEAGARTISADGRYVVFTAYSARLPGVGAGGQVYRRDTRTGALEVVSRATGAAGAPGDAASYGPSISADGARVAFSSFAALDPADADGATSAVYVRDLAAGTTTLASRADGEAGAPANSFANQARISADGGHVTFLSDATNLGVPGGVMHLWLRDIGASATRLVDRANGADGVPGNIQAGAGSPSSDGRLVAFHSQANNLDAADPGPSIAYDVYVRDTVAQTTTLASRRSGLDGARAATGGAWPVLSSDGRLVAFATSDETLAPEGGAWSGHTQVVARELATGQNTLVSRSPGGPAANAGADAASISADGAVVAFASSATNLVEGLGGSVRGAVFARTMATGALSGPPAFGLVDNRPQNSADSPSLSDDGHCLAFSAAGHNAFTGAGGDIRTGYVYVVSGACPKPAPPAGPAPPVAGQASKPAITGASLLRKRFRVGRRPTAKRAAAARRAKPGTAFRFDLSARADVTIALHRRAAGRRAGGRCRKPAPRLRKRPACVRLLARGKLVRAGRAEGRHSIAFSGRVGRRALPRGRYRATLRARNAAGASQPVRLAFRVVRR